LYITGTGIVLIEQESDSNEESVSPFSLCKHRDKCRVKSVDLRIHWRRYGAIVGVSHRCTAANAPDLRTRVMLCAAHQASAGAQEAATRSVGRTSDAALE